MDIEESELINRSLSGDIETYCVLIDRYKHALYRHCFSLVRSEDLAEDIAQETFIASYYALKKFDPQKGKLSTWLFKIATNKALTALKKEAALIVADDDLISSIVSQQPEPPEQMLHHELHAAVKRLRPKYRAIVSLYYWQGLSYKDIAAILDSPEGSIKVWMKRAKQELRKEII